MFKDILEKHSENLAYGGFIIFALSASAWIYYYTEYLYEKNTNLVFNDLDSLFDYIEDFAPDFINDQNYINFSYRVLHNKYCHNFFANFFRLISNIDVILVDLTWDERKIILHFFEFVKNGCTYEQYKDYKINDAVLYKFFIAIKRYIYISTL